MSDYIIEKGYIRVHKNAKWTSVAKYILKHTSPLGCNLEGADKLEDNDSQVEQIVQKLKQYKYNKHNAKSPAEAVNYSARELFMSSPDEIINIPPSICEGINKNSSKTIPPPVTQIGVKRVGPVEGEIRPNIVRAGKEVKIYVTKKVKDKLGSKVEVDVLGCEHGISIKEGKVNSVENKKGATEEISFKAALLNKAKSGTYPLYVWVDNELVSYTTIKVEGKSSDPIKPKIKVGFVNFSNERAYFRVNGIKLTSDFKIVAKPVSKEDNLVVSDEQVENEGLFSVKLEGLELGKTVSLLIRIDKSQLKVPVRIRE